MLIPRGGAGLINAVVEGSKVPVIETGTGNCHLFVDASADQDMALAILLNAKVQRPSVCNAAGDPAGARRDRAELPAHGASPRWPRRGSPCTAAPRCRPTRRRWCRPGRTSSTPSTSRSTWPATSCDSLDDAIAHIRVHTTGHSETIVTNDRRSADGFTAEVDAAAVLVNASSRFVDGGEFGFGAEIGISTQKLHARGPMGLPEMTSTKYIVSRATARPAPWT